MKILKIIFKTARLCFFVFCCVVILLTTFYLKTVFEAEGALGIVDEIVDNFELAKDLFFRVFGALEESGKLDADHVVGFLIGLLFF